MPVVCGSASSCYSMQLRFLVAHCVHKPPPAFRPTFDTYVPKLGSHIFLDCIYDYNSRRCALTYGPANREELLELPRERTRQDV